MRVTTFVLALMLPPVAAGQTVVTPEDRTDLGLTVYEGFTHVREVRSIDLGEGTETVVWTPVPDGLDPGTLTLLIGGRPARLGSLTIDLDPPSSRTLLRNFVGDSVTLVSRSGARIGGTLVAAEPDPVVRVGDTLVFAWRGHVEAAAHASGESGDRSVRFTLEGPARALTAAFLVEGTGWSADYIGVLEDESAMVLQGDVTVRNGSDVTYPDATVQVVAGDVPRRPPGVRPSEGRGMIEGRSVMEAATPGPERVSLGDVHLYTLPDRVTLPGRSTTRVPLFQPARIEIEREYVLAGDTWIHRSGQPDLPVRERPRIRLRFENRDLAGPSAPLPAGTVHIYRRDDAGALQFVGDASLPDTPPGEEIVLQAGTAFDVIAERTRTAFDRVDERTHESAWRIEIRNRGEDDRVVRVVESFPGQWSVLEESFAHERIDAARVAWDVPVRAGGSATLTFRLRLTF